MLKEHTNLTSNTDGNNQHERPPVNISGGQVALGPLRRELMPLYQHWFNNFELLRTLDRHLKPVALDQVEEWFERRTKTAQSGAVIVFTIYECAIWKPIGNTALENINLRDRTAEFGVFIGETDLQGREYGAEATELMLDYAFTGLGPRNIMLRVWEYNFAGLRVYEKAGFREFGRRTKAHMMNGQWWDEVYMQALSDAFESPMLDTIFDARADKR